MSKFILLHRYINDYPSEPWYVRVSEIMSFTSVQGHAHCSEVQWGRYNTGNVVVEEKAHEIAALIAEASKP